MKSLLFFAFALMTSLSFADEIKIDPPIVYLDSDEVRVDMDEALLVRTANTPKKVRVYMKVPTYQNQCVETAYREVYGQSAFHCGYDIRYHYRTVRRCVAWSQDSGTGTRPPRPRDGGYDRGGDRRHVQAAHCVRYETYTERVAYEYPRSCYYDEAYCARYEMVRIDKTDSTLLKFKNAPKLNGEEEIFKIKAFQKSGSNVGYTLSLEQSEVGSKYDINTKEFFGDKIVIKRKK